MCFSAAEREEAFHKLTCIYLTPIIGNFAAFYLQLFGQKVIKASSAALILSLEAIFALIIGLSYAGEVLTLLNWSGVVLVLLSIFLVIKE